MKLSLKQTRYIKRIKRNRILVLVTQILILLIFLILWELLSKYKVINPFIFSSPSRIIKTIITLFKSNNLIYHIWVTSYETIISFLITTFLSLIISIILYRSIFLSKVFDPYLTMLNSLPKVALGPIIIIWVGANIKSIILMSILISLIVSIQTIYNGFINTDKNKIKLLKTFGATKRDILFRVVIPSNYSVIINTLKINISMCLIGVIMGEFLTSKAGIGYLILYGSQVFNLDLVMSGIVILIILSVILYKLTKYIEKHLVK
jgi:NitT/TauT family transport system permease protein